MPRWRRRRLRRVRKKSLPDDQFIRVRYSNGQVKTWRCPPANHSTFGDNTITMVVKMTYYKCEECDTVWYKPDTHTRRTCREVQVKKVLDE